MGERAYASRSPISFQLRKYVYRSYLFSLSLSVRFIHADTNPPLGDPTRHYHHHPPTRPLVAPVPLAGDGWWFTRCKSTTHSINPCSAVACVLCTLRRVCTPAERERDGSIGSEKSRTARKDRRGKVKKRKGDKYDKSHAIIPWLLLSPCLPSSNDTTPFHAPVSHEGGYRLAPLRRLKELRGPLGRCSD